MNNYYNPMQSRVDSLMQQKAMIEQQLQSLQQMNVPNININNIPSNPTPSNFDFNGKWVDGEIIGGTRSIYTVATASALGNVDGSTLVQVPCGASYVISLGNNSALPLTVQDANIIIKKIA